MIGRDQTIESILEFYMGKNTPKRQEFIIDNLRVEKNIFADAETL
jgi:topoisomerase-4 subunit B